MTVGSNDILGSIITLDPLLVAIGVAIDTGRVGQSPYSGWQPGPHSLPRPQRKSAPQQYRKFSVPGMNGQRLYGPQASESVGIGGAVGVPGIVSLGGMGSVAVAMIELLKKGGNVGVMIGSTVDEPPEG